MPTLTLPRPHAAQQQVIDEAARFNIVCCGRRWGKTELGMDRLIQPALEGTPVAWFAPNYKLAAPVWRELQNRLRPITRDVNQQERRLELKGGGTVDVWSLDSPDSGRGRAYAAVVIDEAALIPNLETAWQESIRPQLSDFRGRAWFLSTPKGASNYFHTLYQRGQDTTQTDWKSWQMPTSANPFMPAGEIEAMREDLTDLAYAQEIEALFVSWEGAVFRRILDSVAETPADQVACVIGVDWAGTGGRGDYTVFVAVSATGHVLAIDRFRGAEYRLQRARLRAFWERTGGQSWIFAEVNSMGSPLVEQLQADGLPVYGFTTTSHLKSEMIQRLVMAFERGTIKILNDPALIGELQAFEAKPLPSGFVRYQAPEGMHDDTVIALAAAWGGLALWESTRAQPQVPLELEPYHISPI
jgi:hypothetical protein